MFVYDKHYGGQASASSPRQSARTITHRDSDPIEDFRSGRNVDVVSEILRRENARMSQMSQSTRPTSSRQHRYARYHQSTASQPLVPSHKSSPSTARGTDACLWFMLIVLISGMIGFYFGERGMEDVQNVFSQAKSAIAGYGEWESLKQYRDEDPFNVTSAEDAPRWPNKGRGLEMEMQFAADGKWYTYFTTAVSDWSNCSSLVLTTVNVTTDPDCEPVNGAVKVCNKNWGATGWNGINYAVIDEDGYIYSSTANMNEFYLKMAQNAKKQYVMCHEMGHSFGLGHLDESYWNKNLGSCMDYTAYPKTNMHPNSDNYDFLYQLYGSYEDETSAPTAAPTVAATDAPTLSPTIAATGDRRALETTTESSSSSESEASYYHGRRVLTERHLSKAKLAIADHIRHHTSSGTTNTRGRRGWRLLQKTPYSELHDYEMDHGLLVRAYVVLEQEQE